MTPLEQQVREALTDEVMSEAWHDAAGGEYETYFCYSSDMRERILTALRPLLEQQAAAVATLTAERDEAVQKHANRGHFADAEQIAAWSGETR